MSIKIQNLSVEFGKKKILENINLELKKQNYILVGANGSGKTTFLKAILNLLPYQGDIKIKNNLKIGYSPEIFEYFKTLKLRNFLILSKNLSKKNITNPFVENILAELNLLKYKKYKISQLSKGTKKRVSIAYSVVDDPDFLVRDEPFDGLDFWERENLLEFIKKLNDKGKRFLISTHFPIDFEDLKVKFLFLKDKQIRELEEKPDFLKTFGKKKKFS